MELLLNVVFAWAAVIMMGLLSIIYILRIVNKKFYNNQHSALKRINKALRKPHKWMGILAVFFGFIHGLYSSAKVFTINKGTILWVILIALGINFYLRKTILKGRPWIKAHRKLAILSIAFLLLHLLEVNWFVGIEALQASLERDLRSGISYENFLPNEMKKTLGIEQMEGHGNLITEGKTGGIVYEDALSNALIQDDKAPEEDLLPIKAKSLGEEHRLGHGSEEGKKTKQVFFWGRKDDDHRDRDHDDDYRDNYRDDDDYRDGYRDDDDDDDYRDGDRNDDDSVSDKAMVKAEPEPNPELQLAPTPQPEPEPQLELKPAPKLTPNPEPQLEPKTTPEPAPVVTQKYNDGTYVGEAIGFSPGLVVEVVIESNIIKSVEVISHNEVKEKYWGLPVRKIPEDIVNAQSVEVDAISGATYTSIGITDAVKNALKKALNN